LRTFALNLPLSAFLIKTSQSSNHFFTTLESSPFSLKTRATPANLISSYQEPRWVWWLHSIHQWGKKSTSRRRTAKKELRLRSIYNISPPILYCRTKNEQIGISLIASRKKVSLDKNGKTVASVAWVANRSRIMKKMREKRKSRTKRSNEAIYISFFSGFSFPYDVFSRRYEPLGDCIPRNSNNVGLFQNDFQEFATME